MCYSPFVLDMSRLFHLMSIKSLTQVNSEQCDIYEFSFGDVA